MPRQLADELFGLGLKETTYGPAGDTGSGYVVAQVTGETPAAEAAGPSLRENLADSLQGGLQAGLVDAYGRALRARHDVSINQDVVDTVY